MRHLYLVLLSLTLFVSCDQTIGLISPEKEKNKTPVTLDRLFSEASRLNKEGMYKQALDVNRWALDSVMHDTTRILFIRQRIIFLNKEYGADSAIAGTHKYLEFGRKISDSYAINYSHFLLAHYHRVKGEYEESQKFALEGIRLAEESEDNTRKAIISVLLANMLNDLGNYQGAEMVALEALPITQQSRRKSALFNALAVANSGLENYGEKIYWMQESLELEGDLLDKLILENNLAMGYYRNDNKTKARNILEDLTNKTNWELLYSERDSVEVNVQRARLLSNLALVGSETGRPGIMDLYNEAEQIWENSGKPSDQASLYLRMAEFQKEDLSTARELALRSLEKAREAGNTTRLLEALEFLTPISPQPKAYAIEYMQLSDSIQKANNKVRDAFARYQYDVERTRRENKRLEAEGREKELALERSKVRTIALSIGIALLLAGGFQSYRLMQTRHLLEQSEEIRNTETRISKRIHDELANDLFNTMSFAELHNLTDKETKNELLTNLENIYKRTRNISRENAAIPEDSDFGQVITSLVSQYRSNQTNILLKGLKDTNWNKVEQHRKEALYRVLQELMVNMKKHSEANLVVLSFSQNGKSLEITYKDNGKGMDLKGDFQKGGMQNMQSRLTQTGGRFKVKSAEGKGVQVKMFYG